MTSKSIFTLCLMAMMVLTACNQLDPREKAWCESHNMTQDWMTSSPGYCWNTTCVSYNEAGVGKGCSYMQVKIPEVPNE